MFDIHTLEKLTANIFCKYRLSDPVCGFACEGLYQYALQVLKVMLKVVRDSMQRR